MFENKSSYGKYTRLWTLISCVIMAALLMSGCGQAAESKLYRVGVLSGLDAFSPAIDGLKAKMTELGYVEGENISYDVQKTNVDIEAYKSIAKKFVDDKVDMIFVFPTEASMEVKAATQGTNIPMVFALSFTDVKGINLINSIREPGGNVTGVRFPSVDIASKRLDILLEMVPDAKRVFVPYLKGYPNVPGQLDAIRSQALSRGISLIEFGATSPQDLQAELDSLVTPDGKTVDALLLIAEPLGLTPDFFTVLGKFSNEHQIPIGGAPMVVGDYASIFGLLPDAKTVGEQAALLADKVLKGTVAGTIPVTTADGYFLINYKAAQELGVNVPEGLLKQADEIIR
jgi:putative tryptophan/tyrosine transport system substrate-binding protein